MDTKKNKIKKKIESLVIEESFDKRAFIKSIWGERDYFVDRSFDVLFNNAKREFPERKFKTKEGSIVRTK
jgi:hypothetical protein